MTAQFGEWLREEKDKTYNDFAPYVTRTEAKLVEEVIDSFVRALGEWFKEKEKEFDDTRAKELKKSKTAISRRTLRACAWLEVFDALEAKREVFDALEAKRDE